MPKGPKCRKGPKILHFIIHCLDQETHQGLVWINKPEGRFMMPWPRQGTSTWICDKSRLFKDWARLKKDSRCNENLYSVWKTRVRTALNKIKTVKKLDYHESKESRQYVIENIKEERLDMCKRNYNYCLPILYSQNAEVELLPDEPSYDLSQMINMHPLNVESESLASDERNRYHMETVNQPILNSWNNFQPDNPPDEDIDICLNENEIMQLFYSPQYRNFNEISYS